MSTHYCMYFYIGYYKTDVLATHFWTEHTMWSNVDAENCQHIVPVLLFYPSFDSFQYQYLSR